MPDTIREQIISAIETRLAAIRTVRGFATDCGRHVFRVRHHLDPENELNAAVIWPQPEEPDREYSRAQIVFPVKVELYHVIGTGEPSALSEAMLGDVIEAMTGPQFSMDFVSGGTTDVVPGGTVTGASSSATAVVETLSVSSGAWANGNAAGTLTLRRRSGVFTDGENLDTTAQANVATVSGSVSATAPVDLVTGGLADDIFYAGGGSEWYPDEEDEAVAVAALFHIRYATVRGNPFAQ